jgi:protein-S-isoprenylcysteine O-methyltransferase Ste14
MRTITFASAFRSHNCTGLTTIYRTLSTKYASLFSRRDLSDLSIRVILAAGFAFCAGAFFNIAVTQFGRFDPGHIDAQPLIQALSTTVVALFTLTIACLYVLRLRPKSKFCGIWPCTAALLGGFLILGLLLLDRRTDLPLPVQVAACLLILTGNGCSVYILMRLGRSFSILPESRKLVTSGPYRVVRHPLYLAEAVATLGTMLLFLSPWAVLLVATQMTLQIVRIHYEEKTLDETFPDFKDYAKYTPCLIPRIYFSRPWGKSHKRFASDPLPSTASRVIRATSRG